MILTRCSYCCTVFRVTPEQLRIRNGQVRCGNCDAVFNAIDFLEEEADEVALLKKSFSNHIPSVPVPTLALTSAHSLIQHSGPITDDADDSTYDERGQYSSATGPMVRRRLASPASNANKHSEQDQAESAEWGNQRALYNNALDDRLPSWSKPQPKRPAWPYVLISLPLMLLLLVQILFAYRTPLASNSAVMAALYQGIGVPVPLPRLTELVAIESTDLQADLPNNQLLLLATLRNQATFNQAWPALELTLMDAGGNVISRRVLQSSDYLMADAPPVLAARSELALRLRISAEGLNAANYRLYVFYP
jgi:predicted Zn finger-like uncharacterized protein